MAGHPFLPLPPLLPFNQAGEQYCQQRGIWAQGFPGPPRAGSLAWSPKCDAYLSPTLSICGTLDFACAPGMTSDARPLTQQFSRYLGWEDRGVRWGHPHTWWQTRTLQASQGLSQHLQQPLKRKGYNMKDKTKQNQNQNKHIFTSLSQDALSDRGAGYWAQPWMCGCYRHTAIKPKTLQEGWAQV